MRERFAFPGRVVVITGASGGIGGALAREFAKRGARVALLDRDPAPAEQLAATLPDALALGCDVTDTAACRRAVENVAARFGGIDVLVNNAGITHFSSGAETDLTVLRRVMDVNFFGAAAMTRASLPSLLERRGAIVAISSVAGFAPLVDRCGYAASKHAMHGYFGTLRAELAPRGVRVTMVCPTFTRTGIDRAALDGAGNRSTRAWSTTGRIATTEEVARAVVRGVERGERTVFPSRLGRAAWYVSRFAPALYDRLMTRNVRSAPGA